MKINFKILSFILLFILSVFHSSCTKDKEIPIPKKVEPLPYTFTENKGIVGKWLSISSYDGFDRIWHETPFKYATELEFTPEGGYMERGFEDRRIYCQGQYSMTKPDSVWINSSCYTGAFETAISELTPTILVTQQEGRHGYVYFKYRAIE